MGTVHRFKENTRRALRSFRFRIRDLREKVSPLADIPLTQGEVEFACALPADLRLIVDAGARIDTFYADLCIDRETVVLLIEPNPKFAAELRLRTAKHD
jgi:hypothetical protein